MCSVTFWPRRGGYRLAMNRDELLTRATGIPSARFVVGGRAVLHPGEPGGGTWVSVNDAGVAFALINWYAVPLKASPPTVSRGGVVASLSGCSQPGEMEARLTGLELARMNPFRVMGFFPGRKQIFQWRWDCRVLSGEVHSWKPGQWLSSGHDEPGVQRTRGADFDRRRRDSDAGSIPWIRRLHASHDPGQGPYSMCMHRSDAETVSYTEIEVDASTAVMRYHAGPPCQGLWVSEEGIPRTRVTRTDQGPSRGPLTVTASPPGYGGVKSPTDRGNYRTE
ncbi:MAG: NRDE family protein [Verrucomicrobia bacterium]|nr:NRDE family protein [Verrucomicrobiota bacterium]